VQSAAHARRAVSPTPERFAEILPDAPRGRGLFAFNPPYGHRMQGEEGNEGFERAFNLRPYLIKPTSAAGLRAEFLVFDLGTREAGRRTTSVRTTGGHGA
jgi:23S rRNA G2445 N2-methylase RlmL